MRCGGRRTLDRATDAQGITVSNCPVVCVAAILHSCSPTSIETGQCKWKKYNTSEFFLTTDQTASASRLTRKRNT